MPQPARPRGPLPARVYWVRRAVVLGIPLVLVVVLARLLGGSSDGKDNDQATQAAASTAPSAGSSTAGVVGPTVPPAAKNRKGKNKGTPAPPPEPVLAEPSGPCTNDDIVVTPAVAEVPGGSPAPLTLNVRTRETEACTWRAAPETLTVTITSGDDHIWSSRECPTSIATADLVVRRAVDAPVTVTWNARRSEEGCSSPSAEWARLGWYHIEAAALGGEPTDVQFELVAPSAPVITKTIPPAPDKTKTKTKGKKQRGERHEHRAGDDGAGNSDG